MCGITGFVASGGVGRDHLEAKVATLSHRGPDDSGVWIDEAAGVALGHRRLAIVELSPLGGQPMVSRCGRYVLSFNGEIYNHRALRAALGDVEQVLGGAVRQTVSVEVGAVGAPALVQAVGDFADAWRHGAEELVRLADRAGLAVDRVLATFADVDAAVAGRLP